MIPQTDPKAGYLAQQAEIDAAIRRVLDGGRYILGDEVSGFEAEFAAYAGASHGIACASGTDALILALRALQIGPGDAVFTVSHTAVATVAAIELTGATPVLLDVDDYYGLDVAQLEATLALWPADATAKPKAIIPVHLYGQAADMPAIAAIAARHGLAIIEDGSQAHGARLGGIGIGHWGALTAYSLYPTKNLGAIGDGGIITTNDANLTQRLKELREYGWRERYVSAIAGMNSRLDPIQAAILRVKLTRLAQDTARRQAIAKRYDSGLAGLPGLSLPASRPGPNGQGAEQVYHQYVIDVGPERRDGLRAKLTEAGIGNLVHYPVPVHLQPAYQGRVILGKGGLARTERAALSILSLPMFPQLSDAQADKVIAAVKAAL